MTRRSALLLGAFAGGLGLLGCGSDDGKPFGQEFAKPEGYDASVKANPNDDLSSSQRRRKDIEESKKEDLKKGKRRTR